MKNFLLFLLLILNLNLFSQNYSLKAKESSIYQRYYENEEIYNFKSKTDLLNFKNSLNKQNFVLYQKYSDYCYWHYVINNTLFIFRVYFYENKFELSIIKNKQICDN